MNNTTAASASNAVKAIYMWVESPDELDDVSYFELFDSIDDLMSEHGKDEGFVLTYGLTATGYIENNPRYVAHPKAGRPKTAKK